MNQFQGLTEEDLLDWLAPALGGVGEALQQPVPDSHAWQPHFDWPLPNEPMCAAPKTGQPQQDYRRAGSGTSSSTRQTSVSNRAICADQQTEQPKADKPRRKRGPTSQQQVAELERQLKEQIEQLQSLSIRNVWLSERVRMLEVVIAIRDDQLTRVNWIKYPENQLSFNPFEAINSSYEELRNVSPVWIANKFMEISSKMATKLTPVLPYIQKYPYLLWGPTPDKRWPTPQELCPGSRTGAQLWRSGSVPSLQQAGAGAGMPFVASEALGSGFGRGASQTAVGPEEWVIEGVLEVVKVITEMQVSFQHIFWIKPQMLLASSLHVHAIDPNHHTDWEALWQIMSSKPGPHGAAITQPDGVFPAVAPAEHWQSVVSSVTLSDQQRLQASVLDDLINAGISSIVAHRASLSAQMSKIQQDLEEKCCGNSKGGSGPGLAQQQQADGVHPGQLLLSDNVFDRNQENNIVKKLQLTLVKEGCLVVLGAEAMFFSILTPVQLALVLLGSYPYLPDDMAILHAVAEQCTPQVLSRVPSAASA